MKTSKAVEQPQAVAALVAITDVVLQFRNAERPTLRDLARVIGRASGLLRIQDLDEKISVENAATIQLAKKFSLVS